MKGHIRERSPGHWAIVLDIRDPETGKRRRKWHNFAGTKREAQVECARLIAELAGGSYVEPARTSVAEFLERWLAHVGPQISPRTRERYAEIIRKNIVPALGALRLTKVRPAQISDAYVKALTAGRRDGRGGLSPGTVVYMHRLLKHALAQAVRWEMLSRNPADAVRPPKVEHVALTTFDMAQTATLVEALRGTRILIPVLLGALCGLRRGEIVALKWRHIDLDARKLTVAESAEQTATGIRYKPPKSGKGRVVALSDTVTEALRKHRTSQAQELLRVGIRQSDASFIYTRADGEPLQPRSLTRAWEQALKGTTLPRIRFHDLRHAHATHLLASGVHPKVASERLGHSRIGITLDLYSHVLPGMQEDAATRVDDALRQALEKRAPKNVG